jgi:hypothetical protein
LWLVLCALGVVFGQLVSAGHLVFVSHAICEHGSLLHESHAEGASDKASVRAASSSDEPSASPGPAAEEHEHCDALALRPATIAVGPAFTLPELIEIGVIEWASTSPLASPPIAILHLAPKGSPPRDRSFPS